jgi:enediyne biosynthesis protein E4
VNCSKKDEDTRFRLLPPTQTNVHFSNDIVSTPEFNIQNYLYFYDGGGVAAGDLNNNGLPDLFFTGNMTDNRLYFNLGDFVFEDVTEKAGIINDPDSWSTGVTMGDVTGNGYLDIYVSRVNFKTKSGANQLFINNGDGTFTERAAEFGLDFVGYSTHAAFFDYNNNGRLDLFLLNHTFHGTDTYGPVDVLRPRPHPKAGDRLFRNDDGFFTDVTAESGIYSSALGYGLGLAITDINQDGWPDIYVGNDFHEDDYFYINNGDGTFSEMLYSMVGHTSNSSMGNDVGDVNNNGRMDIISLDMMPEDHNIFLKSGGPDVMMIANAKRDFGFGEKNHRNTLQINRGIPNGKNLPVFSETAFASGIARTEWSWSALLADYDNDGFKDLFVTNGLPRRPNDLDYVARLATVRERFRGDDLKEQEYALIGMMPEVRVPNYMFKNNGDLTFTNTASEWGLSIPSFSNGAVYVDLNNNGLLDLVVNNINAPAFIYQNITEPGDYTHFLKVKLEGDAPNTTGIGTKVFVYSHNDPNILYREQFPTRGFQSSVDHILHFGLGEKSSADSLLIIWPDRRYQVLSNVDSNQTLVLRQSDASGEFDYSTLHQSDTTPLFRNITEELGLVIRHIENTFDDFYRESLMPYKQSARGPALAVADVTGNGLDDIYLGGSRGFAGTMILQQSPGRFVVSEQPDFNSDRQSEDVDAIFFDATGNGLPDLYVVSGGNEYPMDSPELIDRLYINTGNGQFRKSLNSLPEIAVNGSVVRAADFNGNGHLDLFVGGHTIPWRYGIGPQSMILENNGRGIFTDVTEIVVPEAETIGNVTTASWVMNPDTNLPDLIIAGEWMRVHYFANRNGRFVNLTDTAYSGHLNGLWQSSAAEDLTGNGYKDIILGNFGINSRMQPTADNPLKLYVNDFDGNGHTDPIITTTVNGVEKPFEQLDELMMQMHNIRGTVRSYQDFAGKSVSELFEPQKIIEALQKEISELRSVIMINNGDGTFETVYLPFEAQWFPVKSIHAEDVDGDGIPDLILGGNLFDVKPSIGGRQDAGYGLILKGYGDGNFRVLNFGESGFYVDGEIRAILPVNLGNENTSLIVARNNKEIQIFTGSNR